ncbi:MAG: hypothetical protein NVS2B3_03370 [Vulcanimicrobiaceae bacterium]
MREATSRPDSSNGVKLLLSWAFVGIPLVWGISLTLINAAKLFR